MPLLVQIYAPLQPEKVTPISPPHPSNGYRDEFDRLLYVYGCIKKGCIGVRCLRAAQRNGQWAKEGREKRRKAKLEKEDAEKKASENPFTSSVSENPFSSGSVAENPFSSPVSGAVDFGSMIFGDATTTEHAPKVDNSTTKSDSVEEKARSESSTDSPTTSTLWPAAEVPVPIPPRYLATDVERLSSAPTSRQAKVAKQLAAMSLNNSPEDDKEPHKGGRTSKSKPPASSSGAVGSDGWSAEAYEVMRVSGVEEVFLAFQERLEAGGAAEQVVRYEFGGVPLPYSGKSKPYSQLWTTAPLPGQTSAITRAQYAPQSQQPAFKRYDSSCRNVPKCTHCNSSRTFELQLMPNLVTIIEKSLQSQSMKGKSEGELGWATLWCYVCSADCLDARGDGEDLDEDGQQLDWQGWREEVALVELED